MTYTDNRELEGRIFHIAKEYGVPLFEKDVAVEKRIESLFRVGGFGRISGNYVPVLRRILVEYLKIF